MSSQAPEKIRAVLDLMNQVLRPGGDLSKEYPLLFMEGFGGELVTVEQHGELRAALATIDRVLLSSGVRIPAGLIGSVSTHPDHQGCGHGTQLLLTAEDKLRLKGCAIAVLWANDASFYQKRGYSFIGSELDYLVSPELIQEAEVTEGVRMVTPGDIPRIHRLYSSHDHRVVRSMEETSALLDCPGMDVLVREVGGEVVAYACVGRGADLQGVMHEWAGKSDDLLILIQAFFLARNALGERGSLVIVVPRACEEMALRLDRLGAANVRGALAMGKVVNREAAVSAVAEALGQTRGLSVEVGQGEVACVLRTVTAARMLSDEELIRFLVADRGDRELHREIEEDMGCDLSALPLDPFIWGLDSI